MQGRVLCCVRYSKTVTVSVTMLLHAPTTHRSNETCHGNTSPSYITAPARPLNKDKGKWPGLATGLLLSKPVKTSLHTSTCNECFCPLISRQLGGTRTDPSQNALSRKHKIIHVQPIIIIISTFYRALSSNDSHCLNGKN